MLFSLSVVLNLATGNYLNRIALFYSAHFLSSLLALAAVFALWLDRIEETRSVRPPSQMKWRSDPNFSTFKIGRRELVIHRDIASHAAADPAKARRAGVRIGSGRGKSPERISAEARRAGSSCSRGAAVAAE